MVLAVTFLCKISKCLTVEVLVLGLEVLEENK